MNSAQFMRDKINRAIPDKFKNIAQLAEKAGVNQPNLNEFMKGNRKSMNLETAWKLFSVLDAEPEGGIADMPTIKRMGAHSPVQSVEGENLPTVPVMALAGAGPAIEDFNLEPIKSIAVLQEFIYPGIFACKIVGDSMEPTIMSGAYVGVVPLDGNLVEGAIYLVWQPPFGLVAKRVYSDSETSSLILKSDNPKVKEIPLDTEGYEGIIRGRVVWVWQNV